MSSSAHVDAVTAPGRLTSSWWFPWLVRLGSLVAFVAVWEWYGRRGDIFAIAPFTRVIGALVEGIADGSLLIAAAGTLLVVVVAYLISAVVGVAVGVLIAVSEWAENTLEPLVHAGYATPISLMIPVIGIYTGLGFRGRVTLTVFWSIFEIIVNTTGGVRAVPPSLIEVGRAFRARRPDLYRKIVLPAAMPSIALGLRLAVGRAQRGAVTAEVLLSVTNLGAVMVLAGAGFDVPLLLAGILFVMLVGFTLMRLAEGVELRLVRRRYGEQ